MPDYADIDDYAAYTGVPLPREFPSRIMTRASLEIDKALVGARYQTDDDGMPTDASLVIAFRNATCAQAVPLVERWMASFCDDPKMKQLLMTMPAPDGCLTTEAYDILRAARLLPIRHLRMRG